MAAYTTIDDAGAFFSAFLYTGTGSSLGVTGVGFQPDFTWIKNREGGGSDSHILTDAPRAATNYVSSDLDAAEVTDAESLKTFDSDGFTVGTMAAVNTNTEDYVSWNWKMGTTTGIATDGSTTITPGSYSFNTTTGQSVIKYTGNGVVDAKIAHGCGAAPDYILVKNLSTTNNWSGYQVSMGGTKSFSINSTSAVRTGDFFNDTDPDSVNFTVSDNAETNNSGSDLVAYCFTNKQGYFKTGSYVGNSNADGPFVYTGLRPAYILIKRSAGTGDYKIFDNQREGYNVDNDSLAANSASIESTTDYIDILSNGFKLRSTSTEVNTSGIYIYMAFAESPFVNSNGVPTNAR